MAFMCEDCGRVLYNRRRTTCEFCGATIPAKLRLTGLRRERIDNLKAAEAKEHREFMERDTHSAPSGGDDFSFFLDV